MATPKACLNPRILGPNARGPQHNIIGAPICIISSKMTEPESILPATNREMALARPLSKLLYGLPIGCSNKLAYIANWLF